MLLASMTTGGDMGLNGAEEGAGGPVKKAGARDALPADEAGNQGHAAQVFLTQVRG
jgi:hypothetical protein